MPNKPETTPYTEMIYQTGEPCINLNCSGRTVFRADGDLYCDTCGQHFVEIEDDFEN